VSTLPYLEQPKFRMEKHSDTVDSVLLVLISNFTITISPT